ncbi:hypothetical protein GCM10010187_36670 [Actinomadura coerulea]|nr:hypothetical protein GCM10010187_36670 [Actinomadura coerulea]
MWIGSSKRSRVYRFGNGVGGRRSADHGRQAPAVNVVDRAPGLVDRLAASRAQVAGVKNGAAERFESLIEAHTVVMDELSVQVLAHEEALELKEELIEAGEGRVDGVQHSVDGRGPGKGPRLADGPLQ